MRKKDISTQNKAAEARDGRGKKQFTHLHCPSIFSIDIYCFLTPSVQKRPTK